MARSSMTKNIRMMPIKPYLPGLAAALFCLPAASQDAVPLKAVADVPAEAGGFQRIVGFVDFGESDCLSGYSFAGMLDNVITDSSCLASVIDKMLMQLQDKNRNVRIVHIGDSHVRGHIFPGVMKEKLEMLFGGGALEKEFEVFDYNANGISQETGAGGVIYQVIGINGATAHKFSDSSNIAMVRDLRPDLLIISFGTNEASGMNYNSTRHRQQLDELVGMLAEACPDAALLFTTPPGAYRKQRGRYVLNHNIKRSAATIRDYAAEKGYACWDLFSIAGGERFACTNWHSNGLMRRDRIHFTKTGYEVIGCMFYSAFIKMFTGHVGY